MNREFLQITEDIFKNDEFNKLREIGHHGTTRFEHSVRVAYYSYNICKALGLNYEDAARAGLLHDFFLSYKSWPLKKRFKLIFTHPKISLENCIREFNINGRQKDIIESHMFPTVFPIPKYAESWIVSLVDKLVATCEFGITFKKELAYAASFIIVFITNRF